MPKARLAIVCTLAISTVGYGQFSTPVPFERSETLLVGNEQYYFVTRIQQLPAVPGRPREETTQSWEIRDSHANPVYHRDYPVKVVRGSFDSTLDVQATAINTKLGKGILVQGMELPSAPDSGGWVQFFGKQWGETDAPLTAFGPPITAVGEFKDIAIDPRRPAPPADPSGAKLIVLNDVLRFQVWTGNLNIIYPVLINWITGKLEPAWRCSRSTMRKYVDRCAYPIVVDPHREHEMTFVKLFPEPDEGMTPKNVVVRPESDVEYLEAEAPVNWSQDADSISFGVPNPGDVWLKVRIDGKEGWIHTEEDFQSIGLPQAG
jgi:hypothetical protein